MACGHILQLSWWPAKFAAPKQVKVQMKDTLPGIRTHVCHNTVATLVKSHIVSQFRRGSEDVGEYRPIIERQIGYGRNMTSSNEQHMMRSLRVNILKCYNIFVLVDDFARYPTGCNLAEQAVFLHTFPLIMLLYQCSHRSVQRQLLLKSQTRRVLSRRQV
jgi:hypothetical protein